MPRGIYIRTQEHKDNIRIARTGAKQTEECKNKMRGNKNPKWNGGNRTLICLECGKRFEASLSMIKNGRVYCSQKCSGLALSKKQIGENNHEWRGGVSTDIERIRGSQKYQDWRQKVFIRDNFNCRDCDVRGGELNAHHVYPFIKLIEEIKNNLPIMNLYDAAMIYTPMWDDCNGITLCKKCHIERHKKEELL